MCGRDSSFVRVDGMVGRTQKAGLDKRRKTLRYEPNVFYGEMVSP